MNNNNFFFLILQNHLITKVVYIFIYSQMVGFLSSFDSFVHLVLDETDNVVSYIGNIAWWYVTLTMNYHYATYKRMMFTLIMYRS